jgi:LPXTG-motif cell wall-anchored protein
MKKLLLAIVLLLMAQPIFALSASIQPPKMVLRGEAPGSVSGFVDVMNPNNMTVTVNVTAAGGIAGLAYISNSSMTLESNETKKVNFDIMLTDSGNYTGELLFAFRPAAGGQGIALSSQISVIAEKRITDGETSDNNWILSGIFLVILIIAAALIILRGRKK